jgi:heme A synthase
MVLGALVRAHGAGLACPDWPLCFGQLVPEMDMRVAFEYTHRVVAGAVSLGLAGLAFAAWRRGLIPVVRAPLAIAVGLLAVQVVLGGLTVLLRLAPWTVTAHLLVGTSFCITLLWISRDLYELAADRPFSRLAVSAPVRGLIGAVAFLLFLQILLGGLVSSHGAGLGCAQFPTCDGESFAPTLEGLVGLHVLHRMNAVLLLGFGAGLAFAARASGRVGTLAWTALRLLVFQFGVGALNVLLRLPVEMTALHTALAAGLALTLSLAVREVVLARSVRSAPDGVPEAA